jgi:uncharacterized protein (TIGR03083 family)
MSATELLAIHDRLFVAYARGLTAAAWQQPSLCEKWNTHQVLAHLVVGYSMPPLKLAAAMVAHRGNFNRANAAVADRLASRQTPDELIGTFERLIGRPEGIGKAFPSRLLLGDHVLHHLDIALALGHSPQIPGHVVDAVLDTEVHIPNPFVPARRNAGGLTLTATDTGWRFPTRAGHHVEGEAIYLAAALAGRTCALRALSGDGVPRLEHRITCGTQN